VRRGGRNWLTAVLAVLLGMSLIAPAADAVPPATSATATATTTRTIAFGADTKHSPGNTSQGETSVNKLESEIGRRLAFTRDYLLWDSAFPTAFENWLGQRGTVPMISVKSKRSNGTVIPWASVAAAQPGSTLYAQIVSWADRFKSFGYPAYFTFNHEPEASSNNTYGTAADYIAAWRHIHDIFVTEGATNVRFMWIMTDWAFKVSSTDRRYAWKWYPGDSYVDGIAADAYNWWTCRGRDEPWQSLATAISGFMKFGAQHPSMPMWLTEYGSVENPNDPTAKGNWLAAAHSLLQQSAYTQIVGVSYFNQVQSSVPNCDWPVESSTGATAAFTAMGADPDFQGTADFSDSPPPPPPPSGLTFLAASSTAANATTESVSIPSAAAADSGLILIATSATPRLPTAPAGWTLVNSAVSQTMATAVWQRVATASDAGDRVSVGFGGITKGSVELLAYAGTSTAHPVSAARVATTDSTSPSVATPAAGASSDVAVSYWAVRTSVDTSVTPDSAVTARSSESTGGGGRVVSVSGEGPGGTVLHAGVSPAAGHAVSWQIALAPAA
jgi:hypothetical protein